MGVGITNGTVQRYVPPNVVKVGGGGNGVAFTPIASLGDVVTLAAGQSVPPGMWFIANQSPLEAVNWTMSVGGWDPPIPLINTTLSNIQFIVSDGTLTPSFTTYGRQVILE
jgi:hypothetical protein